MQVNRCSKFNLFLLGLLLSGCAAGLEPRLSSPLAAENRRLTMEQTQQGQKISPPNNSLVFEEDLLTQVSWGPVDEEKFWLDHRVNNSLRQPVASLDEEELGLLIGKGVKNTLDNFDLVRRLTNNFFQLKLAGASKEMLRFTINSTIGVGGIFDVAGNDFGIKQNDPGDWVILRWMEYPDRNGPSTLAKPDDRTEFRWVVSFDHRKNDDQSWQAAKNTLREGDLIAYKEDKWEARTNIFLRGNLNKLGYRLFEYGHAALVIKDPKDGHTLRLLSAQSFKGPNIREDIDTLKYHSWDSYRLNQWDRVNKNRLYEFVRVVREKAEKWTGYDFTGMFGLWNSNLKPNVPDDISDEYICSTIVVAALHYAGVELDVSQRYGLFDIITPLQLVRSKGRVTNASTEPNGEIEKNLKEPERWVYQSDR